ncbi:MAG: G/U mismatch-specific DNA glycosylase [Planctomycetota bacterium]|nr:G/U mismatch-specific DNA glycosylase [Planctomycetota bacterium]
MEMPIGFWKPSKEQIALAANKQISDVIASGIKLLFCGINPGLYTAAIEKHFGRPGNRFWPALFAGGFTPRLYSPFEQHLLLLENLGITNLVNRATARADEVGDNELEKGAEILSEKIARYKPEAVAFLGITTYRTAFKRPRAKLGLQEDKISGVKIWVLPNPSGLNAHFQIKELGLLFSQLKTGVFGL